MVTIAVSAARFLYNKIKQNAEVGSALATRNED